MNITVQESNNRTSFERAHPVEIILQTGQHIGLTVGEAIKLAAYLSEVAEKIKGRDNHEIDTYLMDII